VLYLKIKIYNLTTNLKGNGNINMKVSLVIVKILEAWSLQDVFMVTGGGSMHLNDSFGRSTKIKTIPLHHEQACSMAADSYFRTMGRPAVVNVTTGPGAINALNGVYGAYVDSIPMVIISGQVKTEHLVKNINPDLRQFGDQEVDIINMVGSITKSSLQLEDTTELVTRVNEVILDGMQGRKGPVWIDVPLDIQAAMIKITASEILEITERYISQLRDFKELTPQEEVPKVKELLTLIHSAKRPLLIVGNGVRFSDSMELLNNFLSKLDIPVCTVWNSHDIVPNEHMSYAGRPGADGERAGNFNMQNCDLLIIIGARMHVRQVGFNEKSFAREATKVMIDIDNAELTKANLAIDLKINLDVSAFFKIFSKLTNNKELANSDHKNYLEWCKKNVKELSVVEKKHYVTPKGQINPYHFVKVLFDHLGPLTQIITGDGTAAVVTFKAAKLKEGQRLYTNKGCASMGYDIPALLGALYAKNSLEKVLITGDGSIMMNLQELSSLRPFAKEDIKIFILNNDGYHSIRQSQNNYFDGFEVGCGEESNLFMPSFDKIAKAFNLKYLKVDSDKSLIKAISNKESCIKLIEVFLDRNQNFEPRVTSKQLPNGKMVSSPLEEMAPLLDKEEFLKRMLIPLDKHSNYE
jgi:acetolactate synthase-1/2/3 large subunit